MYIICPAILSVFIKQIRENINVIQNLHRYTAALKINQTGVSGFKIE